MNRAATEPFVCPWCGATFARRFVVPPANLDTGSLEGHWRVNPDCSANRAVNNPTQTKYDVDRGFGLRLVDREDPDV